MTKSEANTSLYENQQKYLKTDSEIVTLHFRIFFNTASRAGGENRTRKSTFSFRYIFAIRF